VEPDLDALIVINLSQHLNDVVEFEKPLLGPALRSMAP
jgi:hypothetical protein